MSRALKVNATLDVSENNGNDIHLNLIKNAIPECLAQASPQRRKVLKDTIPSMPQWYKNSSAGQQAVLKTLMETGCHSQNEWDKTIKDVQDITAYAKTRLLVALTEAAVELDVEKTWVRLYYPVELKFFGIPVGVNTDGYRSRTFSLLQAALHNFEAFEAEDGYFGSDSSCITEPDASGHFDVIHPRLKIKQFVEICRKLDIGGQYEKYITGFLYEGEAAQQQALSQTFINSKKTAMKTAAYVALLKEDIELKDYELLVELINEKDIVRDKDSNRRISYSPLRLMGYEIAECALFFPTHTNRFDGSYVIAYIPDDPEHPIKKYSSFADFEQELTHQLMYRPQGSRIDSSKDVLTDYQRFFSRFVSEKDRPHFFLRFTQKVLDAPSGTYWKDEVRGYLKYLSPVSRLVGPIDDRHWRRDPLENIDLHVELVFDFQWVGMAGIWIEMFRQKRRNMLEDAQVLAVSTAAEDNITRARRLSNYLNIGLFVVGIAAFFVPPVGAAMLLVTANQLLSETIEGVREWSQGDKEAAWAHITDVLENLATMVALAPVFHYTISPFIKGLKPVTLSSGKTRLWKPDLKPYELNIKLPENSRPNELGLHRYDGQDILPLDGKHYAVKEEAVTGKYRVQHPARPDAYTPELNHNGSGAWSHEMEQPRTWKEPELMRRLGHSVSEFSDTELAQIRSVSGTDEGVLRRMHVEHEPPAPLLADTIKRFDAYKQVEDFIADMQSDGSAVSAKDHSIDQLHVMTRYGKWPDTVSIRVIDAQAKTLWEYVNPKGTQDTTRIVQIHDAQIRGGRLLTTLLESFDESETNVVLEQTSGTPRGSLDERIVKLRKNIGKVAQSHKTELFNDRYDIQNASSDPRVNLIKTRYSNVPASVIEQLLVDARSAELRQMSKWDFADRLQTKPIPLGLAEELRWVQREVRLSRAYEGLYLDALMSPDTENLVLNTLKKLPGGSNDLRVEVREGSFRGKLRASVGSEGADSRKVLVRNGDGQYEARDQDDGHLHGADNLYAALQHALPDSHRAALGLPHVGQGPLLKALVRQHALPRNELRAVLKMQPIKPWFKAPKRWIDGRLGYPLSGRGAGVSQEHQRVLRLFPRFESNEITRFLNSLGSERERLLRNYEVEFESLRTELDAWVAKPISWTLPDGRVEPVDTYSKRVIRQKLLDCWQRKDYGGTRSRRFPHGRELNLSGGWEVAHLPDLSMATFPRISTLDLGGMRLDAVPEGFLRAFPRLLELNMESNNLQHLPTALGRLSELRSLNLSSNALSLSLEDAATLEKCPQLDDLDLSHNPLTHLPDFSQMPELERLGLQRTGLTMWPPGLRDLPNLRRVDLRDNQIHRISDEILEPTEEHWAAAKRVFSATTLEGNPITAKGLEDIAGAWIRFSQRSPVVQGPMAPAAAVASIESSRVRLGRWLREIPANEQVARTEQWELLDRELIEREKSAGDRGRTASESEEFFKLLESLSQTADYKKSYSDLNARVWKVLDAAAQSEEMRTRLFALAGDRETCADGASLIFSRLEISTLANAGLEIASDIEAAPQLFKLAKGLFRLDEVEKIAQRDADHRFEVIAQSNRTLEQKIAEASLIDRVEIRLAYRLGLRDKLDLPGQPIQALYTAVAEVTQLQLDAAEREILKLDDSPQEFTSTTKRDFWAAFLRRKYADRFDLAFEPIISKMEALEDAKGTMTSEVFAARNEELKKEYLTTEEGFIKGLTHDEMFLASS